jgi:hypothetical protein
MKSGPKLAFNVSSAAMRWMIFGVVGSRKSPSPALSVTELPSKSTSMPFNPY